MQLPADEPALEIAFWPREIPGKEPVPIDALVVTKTLGKGRIVLCQVPLGPWQSDPRSQLFLVDAWITWRHRSYRRCRRVAARDRSS